MPDAEVGGRRVDPGLPCARQPCLHRLLAECPPDAEGILRFAGRYGLLTVTVSRVAEPGRVVQADALPPEPLDIWRRDIRALRAYTDLWDAIAGGNRDATDLLNRKLAAKLAGVRFQLTAWPEGGRFQICYRPARLIDALWRRFAEEIAGIIQCARCPAPGSPLRPMVSAQRCQKRPPVLLAACRMRAWRSSRTIVG
jgi:hypothetical protein